MEIRSEFGFVAVAQEGIGWSALGHMAEERDSLSFSGFISSLPNYHLFNQGAVDRDQNQCFDVRASFFFNSLNVSEDIVTKKHQQEFPAVGSFQTCA